MHAFPIRNDEDLARAMALIEELWDAAPGTPELDLLQVMSEVADAYEARHSTLPAADPIEIISYKLRELGWSQRELARRLGWGGGRVSEILNRKRPLTLAMVRELSRVLDLPPGSLVHEHRGETTSGVWIHVPAATLSTLGTRDIIVEEWVRATIEQAARGLCASARVSAITPVVGTVGPDAGLGAEQSVLFFTTRAAA